METNPVNLFEYEALAKKHLPRTRYDYIAGGATDEITLRRTRAVFDSIMLRPRMLVDIGQRELTTTVLGEKISFPVMLDPSGDHARAHPEGELATVRAAGSVGTIMIVSVGSTYTLEEVAQAATGPIWFQQYFYRDQGLTKEMAQRAEEAGYTALCLTVDTKIGAKRERNIRNRYVNPPSPNYEWAVSLSRDPAATWEDLEWLAATTRLPILVKGIMTGEDAKLCAEYGAKALIVSNHGARQLDTTFATIEVLPEVVEAVDGRIEVYMDGGIRRGSDVIKALALGARAVLIGRPLFWGLAVNGEAGVRAVLEMLRDELDITMALCGRPTIDSIDVSLLGAISPLSSVLLQPQDFNQHFSC